MKKTKLSLLAGVLIGSSSFFASADPILTNLDIIYPSAGPQSTYGSDVTNTILQDSYLFMPVTDYRQGDKIYSHFMFSQEGHVSAGGNLEGESSLLGGSFYSAVSPFLANATVDCVDCGSLNIGYSSSAGNDEVDSVVFTWDQVAEEGSTNAARNTFQLVIIDRHDDGDVETINDSSVINDYDIEFRYGNMEWDGTESGGEMGFSGIVHDVEDSNTALTQIPATDLATLTNGSNVGEAGVWRLSYVDGTLSNSLENNLAPPTEPTEPVEPIEPITEPTSPGEGSGTEVDPFMPIETDSGLPGWAFELIVIPDEMVFIDPVVAIGYDYFVDSGENFASVQLPTGFDNNLFDLLLWNGTDWAFEAELTGGVEYTFDQGGVDRFRIMGIDTSLMLDPNDAGAFNTGLTFIDAGNPAGQSQSLRQVAVTAEVSEPNALGLMALALGGIVFVARRRKSVQK